MAETYFRHKRLIASLVAALFLQVYRLGEDGSLYVLSNERRILLILVALRLLTMVRAGVVTGDPAKLTTADEPVDWRKGILPIVFAVPLVVMFWLTAGVLEESISYAIAVTVMLLLLIVNLVGMVVKSARERAVEPSAARPPFHWGKFGIDAMFAGVYGLVFVMCVLALLANAPEAVEDSVIIGSAAVYIYLLTWVVQGVIAFFTGLIRQAAEETGLRQGVP